MYIYVCTITETNEWDITEVLQDESKVVIQSKVIPEPEIEEPSDIRYEQGNKGNSIVWIFTDLYFFVSFIVYRNNSEIVNQRQPNETNINDNKGIVTLNVDGYTKGLYVFKITIFYQENIEKSHIVLVTVFIKKTNGEVTDNWSDWKIAFISIVCVFVMVSSMFSVAQMIRRKR